MKFLTASATALSVLCLIAPPAAAQESAFSKVAVPATGSGTSVAKYVVKERAKAENLGGEAASRIYGGRAAQDGAWPHPVSLHRVERLDGSTEGLYGSQFCGGSIIARQWVLTAAHCIADDEGRAVDPATIAVKSGATDLGEGDLRAVASVIVHENYDPSTGDADIGLIQLTEPIADSSGPVAAIPVQTNSTQLPDGPAVVIGWGMMEENKFPVDLMETDIDIVSNATCNKGMAEVSQRDLGAFLFVIGTENRIPMDRLEEAYSIILNNWGDALTNNMICAGVPSGKRTSCNGDSGGPLMIKEPDGDWLQVGIVSWGRKPLGSNEPCGHENLYSVYTRVSNYFDWIASHVRG
ncbi:S1 family serine peptidase [Roseovarius indicus]|uniref:S1 family serine peptidase n=1 Tax=Roseovarius indicus TaxID=540747 RepID=UPI0035122DBB